MPWYYSLAPLAPSGLIKMGMKRVAYTPGLGPMWWIKERKEGRISAYFGSFDRWKKIEGWKSFNLRRPSDTPPARKSAAEYTAGAIGSICSRWGMRSIPPEFLETENQVGMEEKIDPDTRLTFTCQYGHNFRMKARTFMEGGHWCPECNKERVLLNKE